MKLAHLRIAGFKSFVDPVDVPIAPGLTGVVGPNGCGKSNLLEAMRWVMGASSAKAMRAGGMEDVIFAGSQTRPARNHAEVALVLDNRDRRAPEMFNDADELEVVRRITRAQGSSYRVNGREARARDVQLLFADASTGANSPAMVRQGQIAELIAAKPANRRLVLEEAAGVSGLRSRRHEGELKLRAAEANLERLDDALGELGRQLESLRRQARQAKRYRRISADITTAERRVVALRWAAAREALTAAGEVRRSADFEVARTQAAAAEAASAASRAEMALGPLREEEAIAAAVAARAGAASEAARAALSAAEHGSDAAQARARALQADLEREASRLADAADALAGLEAEAAKAPAPPDEARLGALRAATEAALAALRRIEAEQDDRTRELARAQAAAHAARESLTALADRRRRLEARRAGLANLADLERAHSHAKSAQADALARAEALDAAVAAASAALLERETARGVAESGLEAARASAQAARTQMQALEAAVAAHSAAAGGGGDGTDLAPGFASVLDVLEVEPGLERAIAAALGEAADAGQAGDLSAAGALARAWIGAGAEPDDAAGPAGARRLSEGAHGPSVLAGRLSRTWLVKDLETAARLAAGLQPGHRLVTPDGALWRWDGYRRRGDAPSPAALRLEARARLVADTERLERARSTFAEASQALALAQAASAAAQQAEVDARAASRAADAAVAAARRALAEAADIEQTQAGRLARARDEAHALDEEARRLEADAAEADARSAPDQDMAVLELAVETARAKAETARATAFDAKSEATEAERARQAAHDQARRLALDMQKWRDRVAASQAQRDDLRARLAQAQAEAETARDAPGGLREAAAQAQTAAEIAEARHIKARDARVEAETGLAVASKHARASEAELAAAREARAAATARHEGAQEALALAEASAVADAGVSPKDFTEADLAPGDPDAEARALERLRGERDGLGAVNLAADDEAISFEARKEELAKERDDLTEAIATLRRGVNALNRTARDRVQAAFVEIDGHFQTLFATLFGGGEAALALVDSDDPLEAGLEIHVSPPGKKLGSMSLMSGGEQALTATALIFAVFLANPAPVCALDEVDAPLDDANVDRFCALLEAMRERTDTRFLIITHNPVTMARMDRLYGVTMAERGVSQLVSVDLSQAEELVAAE